MDEEVELFGHVDAVEVLLGHIGLAVHVGEA